MRSLHKRLLLFDIFIFIILIFNSFFFNIINGYIGVLFLILILFIYRLLFSFEKDRKLYSKDIILDIVIYILLFLIIYYLSGLFVGFVKTNRIGVISTILFIILKEFLRFNILFKAKDNKLLVFVSILLFIFLDITNIFSYIDFGSSYNLFLFIALYLLPAISSNIFCSYLVLKVGYKPSIVYLLFVCLYQNVIPISPNFNGYLLSIINFFLPIFLWYRISLFFKRVEFNKIIAYKKSCFIGLVFSLIISFLLVYLVSGYFHYYALAVGSNSMKNKINKGDVVIVEKVGNNYSNIKVGDIITYNHGNVIIIHRVVEVRNSNGYYSFITKGDANLLNDKYIVDQSMIVGKVRFKIPFVGLPTVWLSGL